MDSIKLFGATIEVTFKGGGGGFGGGGGGEEEELLNELPDLLMKKPAVETKGREEDRTNTEENSEAAVSSIDTEHDESMRADGGIAVDNSSKSEDKHLKKPTKILPCPRCHSLDTKFCYYNNYNVNQPRYFCKACQRYWTNGGAMRSMAIGAGRRKSKSSSAQYRHMTMYSETLQNIPPNIQEGSSQTEQASHTTILEFRKGMPRDSGICEKTIKPSKDVQGVEGFPAHPPPDLAKGVQISTASLISCSSSTSERSKQEPGPQCFQAYNPQSTCLPWNPTQSVCTSCMPVSFYLVNSYPNSGVSGSVGIPAMLTVPCITKPSGSGCASVIGKHSRDGSILSMNFATARDDSPKTSLEKDVTNDPSAAARTSLWTAFRNKGTARDELHPRGFFGAFQQKDEVIVEKPNIQAALQANPSAFLRSLEFHENIQWRRDMADVRRQS